MTKKNYINRTLRLCIIDNEFYPTNEKYEALKKMTINDFKNYASKFLQQIKIQALFQGNITVDSAKNVMDNVLTQLNPQPIVDVKFS